MREVIREVDDAKNLQLELLHHRQELYLSAISGDSSHIEAAKQSKFKLYTLFNSLNLLSATEDQASLAHIKTSLERYFIQAELASKNGPSAQIRRYMEGSDEFNEALGGLEIFTQASLNEGASLERKISKSEILTKQMSFIVSICFVFMLLAALFAARYFLLEPLTSLAKLIRDFQQGRKLQAPNFSGFGEVRDILQAFTEMTAKLNEQKRRQTQFLAAVAHDLRNPVAALQTASETLLEEPNMDANDRDMICGIISRQSKHLHRLIGDLRTPENVDVGSFKLTFEVQDLGPVLNDAVALYRHLSNQHGLTLILPDKPLLCRCDVDRIRQVIHNLISNAIKYSPSGGTVTVQATENGKNLIISVADQGVGIPDVEHELIFKAFERGSSLKNEVEGTGLGLATSRSIVDAHGGKLYLKSSQSGMGSTFTIEVPSWNH